MTSSNIVSILLAIALAIAGFWLGRSTSGRDSKFAELMRELLIARAEGKLSAEEFEQRQEALRGALLQDGDNRGWRKHLWLAPILFAAIAVAIITTRPSSEPSTPVTSAKNGLMSDGSQDELHNIASMLNDKLTAAEPPHSMSIINNKSLPAQSMPVSKAGDLRELSQRLAGKLAKNPGDGSGWLLLAQSYRELKQYREADDAFTKSAALLKPDASTLADWADARVAGNDRKWDDKARELVKRALSIDAKHLKALALAGSDAFENGNYKQATDYWTRMKQFSPPNSMEAKEAEANVKEAKRRQAEKQ